MIIAIYLMVGLAVWVYGMEEDIRLGWKGFVKKIERNHSQDRIEPSNIPHGIIALTVLIVGLLTVVFWPLVLAIVVWMRMSND